MTTTRDIGDCNGVTELLGFAAKKGISVQFRGDGPDNCLLIEAKKGLYTVSRFVLSEMIERSKVLDPVARELAIAFHSLLNA